MAAEAAESAALDEIHGVFEDVKIDVFGAAAVVTGLFAHGWALTWRRGGRGDG